MSEKPLNNRSNRKSGQMHFWVGCVDLASDPTSRAFFSHRNTSRTTMSGGVQSFCILVSVPEYVCASEVHKRSSLTRLPNGASKTTTFSLLLRITHDGCHLRSTHWEQHVQLLWCDQRSILSSIAPKEGRHGLGRTFRNGKIHARERFWPPVWQNSPSDDWRAFSSWSNTTIHHSIDGQVFHVSSHGGSQRVLRNDELGRSRTVFGLSRSIWSFSRRYLELKSCTLLRECVCAKVEWWAMKTLVCASKGARPRAKLREMGSYNRDGSEWRKWITPQPLRITVRTKL